MWNNDISGLRIWMLHEAAPRARDFGEGDGGERGFIITPRFSPGGSSSGWLSFLGTFTASRTLGCGGGVFISTCFYWECLLIVYSVGFPAGRGDRAGLVSSRSSRGLVALHGRAFMVWNLDCLLFLALGGLPRFDIAADLPSSWLSIQWFVILSHLQYSLT
jgi:hypothetical protein